MSVGYSGETALMLSLEREEEAAAIMLIAEGRADLAVKNGCGETALHIAVRRVSYTR